MSIWFHKALTVEDLNERCRHTMSDFLGIRFTHLDENTMTATMPANERTKQPVGIIHGGANVVLAETLASTAANCILDYNKAYCVGLEINANHIRSVKEGMVTAVTSPLHIGRSTQVWEVKLHDDSGKLTCVSRMTAAVIER